MSEISGIWRLFIVLIPIFFSCCFILLEYFMGFFWNRRSVVVVWGTFVFVFNGKRLVAIYVWRFLEGVHQRLVYSLCPCPSMRSFSTMQDANVANSQWQLMREVSINANHLSLVAIGYWQLIYFPGKVRGRAWAFERPVWNDCRVGSRLMMLIPNPTAAGL